MATNSTQAVSAFQQFVSGLEEQIRTLRNDKLAIQASLQTSKTECSDLRRQNNILLKRNDALEKREFDAMNTGTMLAERLGYGSLGEALEGIPTSVDLSEQQRVIERYDKIRKMLGAESLEDLESLLAEPVDLRKLLSADNGPLKDIPLALATRASNSPYTTPTKPKKHEQSRSGPIPPQPAFASRSSPQSPKSKRQIKRLEAELAAIQVKHDELEKKWDRTKDIYKRDFAGWKRYRQWIFGGKDIDNPKEIVPEVIEQSRLTLARVVGPEVADQHSKSIPLNLEEQNTDEEDVFKDRVLVPSIPGHDFQFGEENQDNPKQKASSSKVPNMTKNNEEDEILVPASDDVEIPDALPPSDEPDPETDLDMPSSQTEYESMMPVKMMSFFKKPRPEIKMMDINDRSSSPSLPSPTLSTRKTSSENEEEPQPLSVRQMAEKPKPVHAAHATPTPSTSLKPFPLPTPLTMAKPQWRGAMKPAPIKRHFESSSSGEVEFVDTPVLKNPVSPVAKRTPDTSHEDSRKKRKVLDEELEGFGEDIDLPSLAASFKVPGKLIQNDESTPTATKKGKEKEKYPAGYDYSVHKGRGRYARSKPVGREDTEYEIDPNMNNGMDYQYDEVVRTKKDRVKMLAGECMECAEYYANVGPYPPRLQPPPFRSPSPTSSPSQSSSGHHLRCTHHHNQERIAQEHRQQISRHRAHWERAKTPPGYWEIGFPSTQEVERINEEAKEMHRQKKDKMEQDKRYRKR